MTDTKTGVHNHGLGEGAAGEPNARVLSLAPGPLGVGFTSADLYDYSRTFGSAVTATGKPNRRERARPIQTSVWYPADGNVGEPMAYGDYFELDAHKDGPPSPAWVAGYLAVFEQQHVASGIPKADYDAVRGTKVRAIRGALPAAGPFPVVVYSAGGGGSSWENSVLFECLASHGYVVVASPNAWDWEQGVSLTNWEESIVFAAKSAEASARDMEFHIGFVRSLPFVDPARLALMGFSWGGLAGAIVSARNRGVSALVSLDGSIRWADEEFARASLSEPAAVHAAFLHISGNFDRTQRLAELRGDAVSERVLDKLSGPFTLYEGIRYADAYHATMLGLVHGDFTSRAHVAWGDSNQNARDGYGVAAQYVLRFLDAYLKHDSEAKAWLERTPAEHGIAGGVMAIVSKAAAAFPPPTVEGFARYLRDHSFDELRALVAAVQTTDPTYSLGEGDGEQWATRLTMTRHRDLALGIRKWLVELHPTSALALCALADGLDSDADKAQCWEKALALDPASSRAKAGLQRLAARI